MPRLVSAHFGEIDCPDEAVLDFPQGIPAFDEDTRFAVIEPAANAPVVFLQSMVHPELCLITLPVLAIDPGYRLQLAPEDLRALGLADDRQPEIATEVICLAVVTIPPDRRPTANLMAPVVIHRHSRRALQAIQVDSPYSHQHPLPAREEPC